MDSQLVSSSLSVNERGEYTKTRSSFLTYTEQFYEVFPYYLSIGMTYEQFWNDDPMLAKYYRQAEEMRNDKRNQEMWLQGMYIYEALCDVAPIFNPMTKKGTKVQPYSERPYAITERQRLREKEEKEKANALKAKRFMEALMASNNARFKDKPHKDKGGG